MRVLLVLPLWKQNSLALLGPTEETSLRIESRPYGNVRWVNPDK